VRVTVIAAGFESAQPDRRPRGSSQSAGYPQRTRSTTTTPDGRVIDVRDEPRRPAASAPTTEAARPSRQAPEPTTARPPARPSRYEEQPQRAAEPTRASEPQHGADYGRSEPRPAAEPQRRPERREAPARRVVFDDLDVPDFLK
jgi:hypothetical protein